MVVTPIPTIGVTPIEKIRKIYVGEKNKLIIKAKRPDDICRKIMRKYNAIEKDEQLSIVDYVGKISEPTLMRMQSRTCGRRNKSTIFWFCVIFAATYKDAIAIFDAYKYQFDLYDVDDMVLLQILYQLEHTTMYDEKERCNQIAELLTKYNVVIK